MTPLRHAVPANAVIALLAAVSWGGGDFSGGMGVKAGGTSARKAVRFLLLAHALSLAVLLVPVIVLRSPLPHGAPLAWGLIAGLAAGLSLTAFYVALAQGAMGASAALSGVIAAAVPALVSAWLEGVPRAPALAGFVLAALAIWVIAAGPVSGKAARRTPTLLALAGGLGFGVYFTALRFANALGVWEPLVLARIGSLLTCGLLLLVLPRSVDQTPFALTRSVLGWAVSVAVLDSAGNLFFTWSTRLGRLDIAAVLASLYPASTILLAAWRLHERPTPRQWFGMAMALVAVALITA